MREPDTIFPHVDPCTEGYDPDRLKRLAAAVEQDISDSRYHGARIIVGRNGNIVCDETLGFNNRATGRRLAEDDVFSVMSLMKPWTAVMVLKLVEDGRLQLTTRVAELIPGFEANGKARMTVGHLLSHMSGMGMGMPPVPMAQMGDLDANMAAIMALAPLSEPGTRVSYSASIGYTILGDLIRRLDVKARPYRTILTEDLLEPLQMRDSAIGSRKDLDGRKVPIIMADMSSNIFGGALLESLNTIMTETAELPGGGGWSSALDFFRFAEMLRQGGTLGSARILSPAMVKLATTIHTGDKPNSLMLAMQQENLIAEHPANLGLGFSIRGTGIHLTPFGTLASPSTFGALGIGSMVFWVDREREMTFVMMTAGLMGQFNNYHRFQRLSDMAISALVG